MDKSCGLQGNPDLYGLGVRVGLYIQLLTVGLVSSLLPKSLYSSYFINSNISLFISTWIIIVKESVLRGLPGVEINIFSALALSQLGAAFLLSVPYRTKMPAITLVTVPLRLLNSAYWVWFFWRGLGVLPRSDCPDEYAFFFAKVSLYHWFRTLSKVTSIIILVTDAFGCLSIPQALLQMRMIPQEQMMEEFARDMEEDRIFRLISSITLMAMALLALAFGVISTELTIKWNNIQGVYALNTVGQLVPALIGFGQFTHVTYLITQKYWPFSLEAETEDQSDEGSDAERCPYTPQPDNDGA